MSARLRFAERTHTTRRSAAAAVAAALLFVGPAGGAGASAGARRSAAVPGRPVAIAVGPQSVWVTSLPSTPRGRFGTLSRIDPQAVRVDRTLRVGGDPEALAIRGQVVWVGNGSANPAGRFPDTVFRVDATMVRLSQRLRLADPHAIAAGREALWSISSGGATASAVRRLTGSRPTRTTIVRVRGSGADPQIAVAASVWTLTSAGGVALLSRIDPVTLKIVATISIPGTAQSLVVGNGRAWVSTIASGPGGSRGELYSISALGRQAVRLRTSFRSAGALAYDAGALWVVTGATRVTRVDARTQRITGTRAVPGPIDAITAGFGALWIAHSQRGTVSRVGVG